MSNLKEVAEEKIIQYASRVYEHIANEPQFDATMVDIAMDDMLDFAKDIATYQHNVTIEKVINEVLAHHPFIEYKAMCNLIQDIKQIQP